MAIGSAGPGRGNIQERCSEYRLASCFRLFPHDVTRASAECKKKQETMTTCGIWPESIRNKLAEGSIGDLANQHLCRKAGDFLSKGMK